MTQPLEEPYVRSAAGVFAFGERVTWLAGLVLGLSSFMDWYAGAAEDLPTLSVTGWHTGLLGKLVFAIGAVVVGLALLRYVGIVLPPIVPESLIVLALGSLATIFVLIRLISVPDEFIGVAARGVGIWISLASAVALVVGALLRANEEL